MLPHNDWIHALCVFATSSLAGLSHLLWEDKKLPLTRCAGAILMSGFAGSIVFLMLSHHLQGNRTLLVGVSLLAGIGGASTIEFLTGLVRAIAKKRLDL